MYKEIFLLLLLSGYVFSQSPSGAISTTSKKESAAYPDRNLTSPDYLLSHSPSGATSNTKTTGVQVSTAMAQTTPGRREQMTHIFSEPGIIGIIFGVMVGIVGTVLSIAYCVRFLIKRTSVKAKPQSSIDADAA
ncbi:glycophorin-A isoform X1 [Trichechus manatus latirostris]|uniref:Glycophorin-A n=1 Tax=Trichechus manatus latirostris TaxID=127582 RepID=A0A2Y9RBR0_TRIMA|nr:glycophorin-A isoform X1 [Trichechus manatus latirostris]